MVAQLSKSSSGSVKIGKKKSKIKQKKDDKGKEQNVRTKNIESLYDEATLVDQCVTADYLINGCDICIESINNKHLLRLLKNATQVVKDNFCESRREKLEKHSNSINLFTKEIKNMLSYNRDRIFIADFVGFYPNIPIEFTSQYIETSIPYIRERIKQNDTYELQYVVRKVFKEREYTFAMILENNANIIFKLFTYFNSFTFPEEECFDQLRLYLYYPSYNTSPNYGFSSSLRWIQSLDLIANLPLEEKNINQVMEKANIFSLDFSRVNIVYNIIKCHLIKPWFRMVIFHFFRLYEIRRTLETEAQYLVFTIMDEYIEKLIKDLEDRNLSKDNFIQLVEELKKNEWNSYETKYMTQNIISDRTIYKIQNIDNERLPYLQEELYEDIKEKRSASRKIEKYVYDNLFDPTTGLFFYVFSGNQRSYSYLFNQELDMKHLAYLLPLPPPSDSKNKEEKFDLQSVLNLYFKKVFDKFFKYIKK